MEVRKFQPDDAAAFKALNEEWITRLFALEAKDRAVLDDPQGEILAKGGEILIAEQGGRRIGCCALIHMSDGGYELAKMAVDPAHQGTGAGGRLLAAAVDLARAQRAWRVYIETNSGLAAALRLYRANGFAPVPPERMTASPYTRADVYLERLLKSEHC